jgi:hypothetical protein
MDQRKIRNKQYLVLHELLSMLPLLVARFLKEPGGTNVQNHIITEEMIKW